MLSCLVVEFRRLKRWITSGSGVISFSLWSNIQWRFQLGRIESKSVIQFDTRLLHCISGINTCGQVLVSGSLVKWMLLMSQKKKSLYISFQHRTKEHDSANDRSHIMRLEKTPIVSDYIDISRYSFSVFSFCQFMQFYIYMMINHNYCSISLFVSWWLLEVGFTHPSKPDLILEKFQFYP